MRKWIICYCLVGLLWASFTTFKQYDIWPDTSTTVASAAFIVNAVAWPISLPTGIWAMFH